MGLGLDRELLSACVQCGLCLTACPTYQVTGDETRSPRGRIALMRAVEREGAPLDAEVIASFDSCIQCRACEPACPSDVRFGWLMEDTRAAIAEGAAPSRRWLRPFLAVLLRPRLLRLGSTVLAVLQRMVPLPSRLGLPRRLPLRRPRLVASGADVHLFTGCVMDAWQREVHVAAARVLAAAGFGVMPTGDRAACCGALHAHAGFRSDARRAASAVIVALDDDLPILVDSAGCGAAMKEYGHLLGTAEAVAFSARVRDVQEFVAEHMGRLPAADPLPLRVAVQHPCHLRNVQRVHAATRTVLAPYVRELVELDDDGLCCGAGGAFAVLQPELAGAVRDRKVASIERSSPDVVASANPGCALHLANAGVRTRHPMEIVSEAIAGGGNDPVAP